MYIDITWLDLIICALATYRLASLFVHDTGPFRIFARLRAVEWLPVDCIRCVSGWAAIIVLAIYLLFPPAVYWLAIWGLALMLRSYTAVDDG